MEVFFVKGILSPSVVVSCIPVVETLSPSCRMFKLLGETSIEPYSKS